ncbi:MAG: contact-dependent growth inhibition system immunity protein [Prosthecobacter sp.]
MMKIDFDLNRSLQELDGEDWGEPNYASSLVIECHRLRRLALRDFTDSDLRRMIGQQISLPYLVPLALRELHGRPQADGDLYPGALLESVLKVEAAFWEKQPGLAEVLLTLINNLSSQLKDMEPDDRRDVLRVLGRAGPVFAKRCGISGAHLPAHAEAD